MNILSVNNTVDVYGASRCMERVFGRFVQDGHNIHAVLPENGPLVELLKARGVRVHIRRCLSIVDRAQVDSVAGCFRFVVLFPISVIQLIILTLRFDIDVIQSNTGVLPSSGVAAFITGRPHVWHIRELFGEFGRLWKPYQRYISHFSTSVVAISRCTRDQFDPTLRSKVQVIYDGLEETLAKVNPVARDAFRSKFPADKLLIGVVGRIKWHRKGQEVLVRAAARLQERYPHVHYVLVGSPAPGNELHEIRLRELIVESNLESHFTFVGDTQDPMSVFAALDVAVVPSVQPEPFGCVVIEAMSAGTPVVGSRCGGIAEQIVDEVSGLLFAPGDSEGLANALERLINDPALRQRMAKEGFDRVREAFPLENTYRQMASIFEQAAKTRFQRTSPKRPLVSSTTQLPEVLDVYAVLGVNVAASSYRDIVQKSLRWAEERQSRALFFATVHMIMEAYDNSDYRRVLNAADVVNPDGMPLVWAMRALGANAAQRIYGPDTTEGVLAAAENAELSVGFYGGSQSVLDTLVETVRLRYPKLRIVFMESPPFRALTADEDAATVERMISSQVRLLFVGLGCPKQERWVMDHVGRVPAVMFAVGAAFDFLAGTKPQAPRWMMRSGLEWVFRLVCEPRRLAGRYLKHNPRFVAYFLQQLVFGRQQRKNSHVDARIVE
jgi:N-acetylglucosaminyldiphosphoundecaprenol N-acetyl-beta-D-mannosaminyltransferase